MILTITQTQLASNPTYLTIIQLIISSYIIKGRNLTLSVDKGGISLEARFVQWDFNEL